MNAFTARLPLAVMIAMGIKQWENRSAMPTPSRGCCAMTVSRGSTEREYANFLAWAGVVLPPGTTPPGWAQVAPWRGNVVAVCDYEASLTPGPAIWDEGYPVWWRLTNVRLLVEPIPCRGSVGMWRLPEGIAAFLNGTET